MMLSEGDMLPDAEIELPDESRAKLSDFAGAPLVIYFYPKDDTPGCTKEAQAFTALAGEFGTAGVRLLGISKDPPAKHRKFTDKYDLAVPLATDADGSVTEAFGVWVEKNMYGRKYMGVQRATFLADASGTIIRVWPKVKVAGHAEEVLKAARALRSASGAARNSG